MQQASHQRRVGDVEAWQPGTGNGHAGAHLGHLVPGHRRAIERLLPAHCGHKKASGKNECKQEGGRNSAPLAATIRHPGLPVCQQMDAADDEYVGIMSISITCQKHRRKAGND